MQKSYRGVLALFLVSLSLSFLPCEKEIMISITLGAVGFGGDQPWVRITLGEVNK